MDLVAFPWTDSFGAYRLHEVSRYVTTGFGLSGVVCFAGISLQAWDALGPALKETLPEIRQAAVEASGAGNWPGAGILATCTLSSCRPSN